MEELKQIIAQNIIALRRGKGLTQAELAEKLNYTDKAVSKWERGESIPDVAVLKSIADLFEVTVDYLLTREHNDPQLLKKAVSRRIKTNRSFITLMCVLLVWLVATLAFVVLDILVDTHYQWLSFVYAVPVSFIVWLVLNSVWFNVRLNYLIVSLLMWSLLLIFMLTLHVLSISAWQVLLLGIPGQVIILLWSRLQPKVPSDESSAPASNKAE